MYQGTLITGGKSMFIIFGFNKQTLTKHGPVFRNRCDRCNNEELWLLFTRRTWFTLFFIPVIPYATQYLLVCPICSYGLVITREKFEELKKVADCNMDLINNRIDENEHKNRIIELTKGRNTNRYNDNDSYKYSGKTETQINYLRQMEEIQRAREEAARAEKNNSDV